jgi:hypothetical protein
MPAVAIPSIRLRPVFRPSPYASTGASVGMPSLSRPRASTITCDLSRHITATPVVRANLGSAQRTNRSDDPFRPTTAFAGGDRARPALARRKARLLWCTHHSRRAISPCDNHCIGRGRPPCRPGERMHLPSSHGSRPSRLSERSGAYGTQSCISQRSEDSEACPCSNGHRPKVGHALPCLVLRSHTRSRSG